MVRPTRRQVGLARCADRRPVPGRNAFPLPQRSLRKGLRRYYAAQVGAARRPYHRGRHPPCGRAIPGYPHLNFGFGCGIEARVEVAATARRRHNRLRAIDCREADGDFMERTEPDVGRIAAGLGCENRIALASDNPRISRQVSSCHPSSFPAGKECAIHKYCR